MNGFNGLLAPWIGGAGAIARKAKSGANSDLATVKAYLGIVSELYDEVLSLLIEESLAEFELACGVPLRRVAGFQYEFPGNGKYTYTPPLANVNAVTKLEFQMLLPGSFSDVWNEVPGGFALVRPNGISRILLGLGFTNGFRYRATLTAGFDPLPADIVSVVRERVAVQFHNSGAGRNQLGIRRRMEEIAGVRTLLIYEPELVERRWHETIARYKPIPA